MPLSSLRSCGTKSMSMSQFHLCAMDALALQHSTDANLTEAEYDGKSRSNSKSSSVDIEYCKWSWSTTTPECSPLWSLGAPYLFARSQPETVSLAAPLESEYDPKSRSNSKSSSVDLEYSKCLWSATPECSPLWRSLLIPQRLDSIVSARSEVETISMATPLESEQDLESRRNSIATSVGIGCRGSSKESSVDIERVQSRNSSKSSVDLDYFKWSWATATQVCSSFWRDSASASQPQANTAAQLPPTLPLYVSPVPLAPTTDSECKRIEPTPLRNYGVDHPLVSRAEIEAICAPIFEQMVTAVDVAVKQRASAVASSKSSKPIDTLSSDPGDIPAHGVKPEKVCCHWKNKGTCKLEDACKFLHPAEKRGVGRRGAKRLINLAKALGEK